MRILEFTIPGLPKQTNQSLRGSWRAKHAEAKKWKGFVRVYALGKWRGAPAIRANLTLTRHSSVEPDYDGLVSGLKHVIDGLVECGILANDKSANIGVPTYRWEKAKPGKGCVSVRLEEVCP